VHAPSVANPIRLSATPIRYARSAPTLGEHTDRVLKTLPGMSDQRLAELREQRVI
jgi:crotonobetainyl-CoA:carnitine CoA-transferase CaiB-like acyl-CoA transferase